MHINEYGQISRTEEEVIKLLYQDPDIPLKNIKFSEIDTIEKFNRAANLCGIDISINFPDNITLELKEFDSKNQKEWFMPKDGYCPNLFEMLYSMCETDTQKERVSKELELFIKHDMIELLDFLKYLVDTMREKNIIWGVGRGSSVASYVLYLIGVHKIDSLKYNLDIGEFLK